MTFSGEVRHTLDEKGRIVIPSRYRPPLKDGLYITRGFDNALFIFSLAEWNRIDEKLRGLPLTNPNVLKFMRFWYSGAVQEELDAQGRLLIPKNLREYAKIEKEVVIIGVSNRLEVWSAELWDEYFGDPREFYKSMGDTINAIGI
ncbi:division/cell wall cluster transcriptional repressor MraZ [bacterium]|nr:division/cell wall cluster transcriptional repressor MraZ [bacterium]